MSLIPYIQYGERVVAENSPLYADVDNRVMKFVTLTSGLDDTQDFRGFASGAVGNGSPEGVVSHRVGAIYGDRTGASGVVWVKTAGVGNIGWKLLPTIAAGSGTVNTLVKFGALGTLVDSHVTDDGSLVTITGPALATTNFTANTSVISPLFGTITAVDPVFRRNSVTQLTLGSLAATFAGTAAATAFIVGTNPATVGGIRLPNGSASGIVARNAANGADFTLLYFSNLNETQLVGGPAGIVLAPTFGTSTVVVTTGGMAFIDGAFIKHGNNGFIQMGSAAVATTGVLKLRNNVAINWRNAADSVNVTGMQLDASNILQIGLNATSINLNSAATFTSSVTATSFIAPLFGTITAVDVVIQRNSVTQLTLGSLTATFAGAVTITDSLWAINGPMYSALPVNLNATWVETGDGSLVGSRAKVLRLSGGSLTTAALFVGYTMDGTFDTPTVTLNQQRLVTFGGGGFDGTSRRQGPQFFARAIEDWNTGALGGEWVFAAHRPGTTALTNLFAVKASATANIVYFTAGANTLRFVPGATAIVFRDSADTLDALTLNAAGTLATFNSAVTMTSTLAVTTSITSPIFGTTTAVSPVIQRNSVTQVTFNSLSTDFAGTITAVTSIVVGTDPTGSQILRVGGGIVGSSYASTNGLWLRTIASGATEISGSTASATGANVRLFGQSHATQANDIEFRSGATVKATYDDSATVWNFAENVDLASGKVYKVNAVQVVAARITGYAAMTGTANKATVYDTATVTLAQLAGRMMQLQADLTTHGLIGP